MLSDKEQKKIFKEVASKEPDKYYPTKQLKELNYMRKLCNCGAYFWTTHSDRDVCGDPACAGGFQVVIDNPSSVKLSFVDVWKKIDIVKLLLYYRIRCKSKRCKRGTF